MRLKKLLYYHLYVRLCQTYAKHFMGDKTADLVLRCLCALHFWRSHGYWPKFVNPRSFSEKIWNHIFYCRDPRLTLFADKFLVRDYVKTRVGEKYLIPLLWTGPNPSLIPYDQLPGKFVIKANHGSGYYIIVKDKNTLDKEGVRSKLQKWLSENYCWEHSLGIEWCYKNISPCIIIEALLEEKGTSPVDYKFFCFSGRVEYVQIDFDRFLSHSRKLCDRDCNPIEVEMGYEQYHGIVRRPENYEEMIHVAEALAKGINFVRVDLYSTAGKIYMGELTNYPGSGTERFTPTTYDFLFGEKWGMK